MSVPTGQATDNPPVGPHGTGPEVPVIGVFEVSATTTLVAGAGPRLTTVTSNVAVPLTNGGTAVVERNRFSMERSARGTIVVVLVLEEVVVELEDVVVLDDVVEVDVVVVGEVVVEPGVIVVAGPSFLHWPGGRWPAGLGQLCPGGLGALELAGASRANAKPAVVRMRTNRPNDRATSPPEIRPGPATWTALPP